MNIEQVREYTLSLYGVTEDQPFGDVNDAEPRLALKLPPERNEELRSQFSAVTPAYHWNKKHWSDVYYEQLDESLVQAWIMEAYQLIVSKLPKAVREDGFHNGVKTMKCSVFKNK